MKRKLLEFLACTKCKSPLELKIYSEDTEIKEGSLTCKKCDRTYMIKNYIPRMLPDRIPEEIKKTAESFGYEWHSFPKLYNEYEGQFLDWIYPIDKEFFKNKTILDAGCGVGRHIYYSARFGAKEAIGIDVSNSVDLAYEHVRAFPNAHIIQADVYHLPFRKKFDFIYSIGVLHHLPNPEKGFRSLSKVLRLGGTISIWVYGKEGNKLLKLLLPVRKVTKNLPIWLTKQISLIITISLYPFIKLIYPLINKNGFAKGITERLPQKTFFNYLSAFNFFQIQSIFFDQLFAPIANYYTKEEFEKWFSKGFKNISITWRNKNSWRGTAISHKEVQ